MMEYLKLEAVVNDFITSTGSDFVDEDTYFQWASDCLDIIGGCDALIPQVKVLKLFERKAVMPKNWVATDIIYEYIGDPNLIEECAKEFTTAVIGEDVPVTHCCNRIEVDPSCAEDSPWLRNDRMSLMANVNKNFRNMFVPLSYRRRANFPNSLEHKFTAHNVKNFYTFLGKYIVVQSKAEYVVVFYFGKKTDERCLPLIPNVPEVINAIVLYIEMKIAYVEYRAEKDNKTRNFFNDVLTLYNAAAGKARAALTQITFELASSFANILQNIVPNYEERYAQFTKGRSTH